MAIDLSWELFNQRNILLKISKKTSVTYSDFQVLKDKILIQANEINYENH